MASAHAELEPFLGDLSPASRVVVLTGAGISAESGIPTFRGPEGYWTVGSRNYRAEELATFRAFSRMPEEIWSWYLHRRSVCLGAEPNAAIQFEILAIRGASAVPNAGSSGLHAWLEALRRARGNSNFTLVGIEQNADSSEGEHHYADTIPHVCEASAAFCREQA